MSSPTSRFAPIAIIGMGCRFPKAPNLESYWRMLVNGVDGITEVPASRWNVDATYDPRPATPCKTWTRSGGFVEDIEQFDPYFFGISPREAIRLDPQQRLLLETTWQAMEHAGISRADFKGSHTGVFVGVCSDDYLTLQRTDVRNLDIYLGTGGSRDSTAGRVAYAFGLTGPVAAIDSACSSSLVAVHQACNSLQNGDCEMAVAGGVNVILHPGTAITFSQANLLSPDGRCKAFDARANGFVRSEGAGMVLLKRLDKAIEDGDPIHAVIRSTASNNDGSSSPFMTPSRHGQTTLLRQAYDRAEIDPKSIQYVEAHGTGTEVGDPIELGAISEIVGTGRRSDAHCLVGSSKTNIGHLEAAAGIAGLIKTVLSLNHKVIPQNLHFETPNPKIPWSDIAIKIPTELTPWPAHQGPARAGVNSFGISGTNAHVVLEEAPEVSSAKDKSVDSKPRLLLLSGHTTDVLASSVREYRDWLASDADINLDDMCYSAALRRTLHEQRISVVAHSATEFAGKLSELLDGHAPAGLFQGAASSERDQKPVFIFSGIGTQWAQMGKGLLSTEPGFHETLAQCDALINKLEGWSLLEVLDAPSGESIVDRVDIMQPAIFSIQVALAALWKSWGVTPSAVVGHSLGEIAAAYVAGALSLSDAILIVCTRSRLMSRVSGRGRMAAVGLTAEQAQSRIQSYGDRACVSVINAPTSCTISGDTDAIEEIAKSLEAEGVFCRILAIDVACHSNHMDGLTDELRATLHTVEPRPASIPLYSTLRGREISGTDVNAQYWAENTRNSVQFERAMSAVLKNGHRVFLELSPNAALLTPIRQNAKHAHVEISLAGSLKREHDERASLLESVGTLVAGGARVDLKQVFTEGEFLPPPAYTWQRERFWFHDGDGIGDWGSTGFAAGSAQNTGHPLLGNHFEVADSPGTHVFQSTISLKDAPWWKDHSVEGHALFPAAAYVELALAATSEIFGKGPRVLRDVKLQKPLFFSDDAPVQLQVVLSEHDRHSRTVATTTSVDGTRSLMFECFSRNETQAGEAGAGSNPWTLLAVGHVDIPLTAAMEAPPAIRFEELELDAEYSTRHDTVDFYASLFTGMEYGPAFQCIERSWSDDTFLVARMKLPASTAVDAKHYRIHPVMLDGCFHSIISIDRQNQKLALPYSMGKVEIFALPDPTRRVWCKAATGDIENGYFANISLYDDAGTLLVRVSDYNARILENAQDASAASLEWLYEAKFNKVPPAATPVEDAGDWLLIRASENWTPELLKVLRGSDVASVETLTSIDRNEIKNALVEFAGKTRPLGIVFAASVHGDERDGGIVHEAARVTRGLLNVLHECSALQWKKSPRIFVLTNNAKPVASEDGALESLALSSTTIAGLARVAAVEMREFLVTQIDVDSRTSPEAVVHELLHADGEFEIVLRNSDRFVRRLARLDTKQAPGARMIRVSDAEPNSYQLESAGTGVFDDLKLHLVPRKSPAAGEVEVRVAAAGLNFLDVLKALNMAPGLPASARFFGMECSGRVVAVGEGVSHLKVGDEVVVLDSTTNGCFRAFLTVGADAVLPKPAHLGLIEAATIPVAYQTAWYALHDLGRLRKGESILIHSAAGGVGLAALEIALKRGAIVYATAGSQEKRDYLLSLGASYVMNSRTLDFGREVMEHSNGRGVDMVLNSLAGEAIPLSLSLLATGGRFLEIGKRDIYADSQLGLLPFQRNLSFFAIDLLRMRLEKPDVVDELTRDIAERMADGTFKALPYKVFPVHETADAFRYMAKGTHTGKIIVTFDDEPVEVQEAPKSIRIREDGVYVITGGLGALGIEFAKHLVTLGARHLALLGRRAPGTVALAAIADMRAEGVAVDVVRCDVADATDLDNALRSIRSNGIPICGMLHAAGVIDDKTLEQLTWSNFESVFASKVNGGWNLHILSQADELDFFVLFSSASSVMGGAGQANYASANAFLDGLAHYRHQLGQPALSVNWGPWADVGMAAIGDNLGARMAERGFESIPLREGTELLTTLLQQSSAQAAVMPINWPLWSNMFPDAAKVPFLEEFAGEFAGQRNVQTKNNTRQQVVESETRDAAIELLVNQLRSDAVKILRVPEDRLNARTSLTRFGLDSLMAVELKNRIETEFTVNLPTAKLLAGPTILELAEWLAGELLSSNMGDSTSQQETPAVEVAIETVVNVSDLSDDEVSAMLGKMLAEPERS